MPSLIQGRIVYPKAAIPDPQGRNPKPGRPFVVITRTVEIKPDGRVQLVGITTALTESPSDHYVHLDSGNRQCKTRLPEKSAALCTWLVDVAVQELDYKDGYVRPDHLQAIVEKVKQLVLDPPSDAGQEPESSG